MTHPATRLLEEAGPTVSIGTAAKVLGVSRAHAYALAERGELGVRVLRLGARIVVPTVALRRLLDGDESEGSAA
jgi:hypothetical protein